MHVVHVCLTVLARVSACSAVPDEVQDEVVRANRQMKVGRRVRRCARGCVNLSAVHVRLYTG